MTLKYIFFGKVLFCLLMHRSHSPILEERATKNSAVDFDQVPSKGRGERVPFPQKDSSQADLCWGSPWSASEHCSWPPEP